MLGHHTSEEHAHGTHNHQTSSHHGAEEHIERQAERKGTAFRCSDAETVESG